MTHPGLGLKNLFIWKGLVRTEPLNSAGPLVSVGEEAGTLTEAPLGASGGPRGWAVLVPRGQDLKIQGPKPHSSPTWQSACCASI